jgi:RimJ/RimL family protein N-acetyltransferase
MINETHYFLTGEKIYLRPLEKDDLPLLMQWANDPQTRALTGEVMPMSQAAALEFYEKVQKIPSASGSPSAGSRMGGQLANAACCACSTPGAPPI